MDSKSHWEDVYRTKAPTAVSWYSPHLTTSLQLIQRLAPDRSAPVIDVGGGESTLVDDLLALGYEHLTVLDISQVAIDVAKERLGACAARVSWIVGDVTQVSLPRHHFEVWHDRAVFHFLTTQEQRNAYVRNVSSSMKPGGHVIVATFGPQGPEKCSGLNVVRYHADSLHDQFGAQFQLLESKTEIHHTPFGTTQQFLYCLCKVE